MSLQDPGNIGGFVGSTGVMASLVYVGLQIWQNTVRKRQMPYVRDVYRWLGVGVLLTLTACGPDNTLGSNNLLGPDAAQGIDGIVLLGPQCPVQSLEDPCPDIPYAAFINVRTAAGELVTRIQSDDNGQFRVGLRTGQYVLDPESGNPFPIAGETEVVVEDNAFTEVTVSFDTGIR